MWTGRDDDHYASGCAGEFEAEAAQERRERLAAHDTPLMRALGLAYYWQRLMDEGKFDSLAEIAEARNMDTTHVQRLMRLTLLAPRVLEVCIYGALGALTQILRRPWPSEWDKQEKVATATA